jgi:LuxR family maltose regulon positive regulatory protein
MDSRLLVTKFHVPLSPLDLVARARLFDQLDNGLSQGHRLTLVSAPAGFGKTTLITGWLSNRNRSCAWLSLDEADNDPVHFLDLLITAIQQVNASFGQTAQQFLQLPQPPPLHNLCAMLINDIAAAHGDLILVLDDYHLITDPAIHQMVGFFIEHQPACVHTVLITREDPPLPIARLRVRHQITEIRAYDLRFTSEETAAFFDETMKLKLSPDVVHRLQVQTEGWIAGLQLAALALDSGEVDTDTFVASFTGSDRYVVDYLMSEVLQR